MKLLSIANSHTKDGSSISLLITLLGLKERGVEIKVVLPYEGFLSEELKKNGIDYILSPITYWACPTVNNLADCFKFIPKLIRTLFKQFKSYYLLKKFIKHWKPDVIHTNVSVINVGFWLGKNLNIPHVWHIREYGDLDFNIHPLSGKNSFRKDLKKSYAICITKDLKNYHGLGDRAKIIYNAIEKNISVPHKIDKENKIIFVGRLTPNKGVEEVIDAFISYCKLDSNLKLDLIGSCLPNYEKYLKEKISSSGQSHRISLLGPSKDPYPLMQKAKAIIVASKSEGFGRITAEAMLNNCLVIGRDSAGTKEQFDNGRAYAGKEIGIRYGKDKNLVDAILTLSRLSEDVYWNMIKNARHTVEELYSFNRNISSIFSFLKEVTGNNKV